MIPTLLGLLLLTTPAQAADVPADPTLGAGKVVVRFTPSSSGEWLAQAYYSPPRGKLAIVSVSGSIAGSRVELRDRYAGGPLRVSVVDVSEYAPELSQVLTPVRVERRVTREGSTYHVTVIVSNEAEHPVMVRLTYSNWTHLDFGDRTLDQDVSVVLEGEKLELEPFSVRDSRFVRADLVWTDAGGFRYPYTRLGPGDSLTLHLDVTADRSPGKVTVTRRLLLSDPPVPVSLTVSVLRPANYGLDGKKVSFWVPAPGVDYLVRYLAREGDRLVPKSLEGEGEYQGVVSVELQGEPELVSVYLKQPARMVFEVRDRVKLSLRSGSNGSSRLWVRWASESIPGGLATDVRLKGRAGRVLLGLVLDSTGEANVDVSGGTVLERGTLPSGRAYAILDAGPVNGEKVVRVTSNARVLDVLSKVVDNPGVA
ncbi:hypothetical protein [Methanopyrus kandleri]|uniref:Uncharacterized protein specific for M.kandleri, MK-42 family n=1 Tax=Methanopyrus kandleri (strain AV19 / DSM 6324 / JCM 9639 / NBRC 100938) TaxID=190192 RepID=Q8TVQ2_METKA|nr:hypothetical protein [Methanopyrus kandleri]AAM02549.1 Uncharacterized protein specific for M.kandleri, MK-42 family [Methanopyrus kandleri AV19]